MLKFQNVGKDDGIYVFEVSNDIEVVPSSGRVKVKQTIKLSINFIQLKRII
jgi:hypothetical protein